MQSRSHQKMCSKLSAAMGLVCEEVDKLSILILKLALSAAGFVYALSLAIHALNESLG
jgi:hypothetical protein